MRYLPKINDVVVHRETGSKYVITSANFEENCVGEKVWKFKVAEMDSEYAHRYLLQLHDIGDVDSPSDYYLQSSRTGEMTDQTHPRLGQNLRDAQVSRYRTE